MAKKNKEYTPSDKARQFTLGSIARVGACAYLIYIIYSLVVMMGIKTEYLKMLSAIIVVLFLAVPYLKGKYFTKQKPLPVNCGGDDNA